MKTLLIIIVLATMSIASSINLCCIQNSINEANRMLNKIEKELKDKKGES